MEVCPCGNSKSYAECCELLHLEKSFAQTAEQLMRSRYSAFCKGKVDYIIATIHPSKRAPEDRAALIENLENNHWLRLQVVEKKGGMASDQEGIVEFIAIFQQNQEMKQLHERSNFIKEDGKWYYVDGKMKTAKKISRNEVCWCGTGKKFKKCHGK